MGLDQYAYVASKAKAREEYFDNGHWDKKSNKFVSTSPEPRELAYWRKHPNLQGWMDKLWQSKGSPGLEETDNDGRWGSVFNGIELELTWEDIEQLESDIKKGEMAKLDTTGFFFGNPSDSHYREMDLQFCADARFELFLGHRVFYNSSW